MVRGRSPFVLFSFSVLLYILGFLLLLVFGAEDISSRYINHQSIIIELVEHVDNSDIRQIKEALTEQLLMDINDVEYISPADAMKLYNPSADMIRALDGENPFYPIMILSLSTAQDVDDIRTAIKSIHFVQDVIVNQADDGSRDSRIDTMQSMLAWIVIVLSILVCIIIYQFIRLLLREKRAMIHLMRLSGAYDTQILKPFLGLALTDALLSSLIAVILIGLTIISLAGLRDMFQYVNAIPIALSIFSIVILGIVIYTVSTYIIVKLYLKNNS